MNNFETRKVEGKKRRGPYKNYKFSLEHVNSHYFQNELYINFRDMLGYTRMTIINTKLQI